jgi:hypothetical protein
MLPKTIILDGCVVTRDQRCTRGSSVAIISVEMALQRSAENGFPLDIDNIPVISTGNQIFDSRLLSRLADRQLRFEDLFRPNQW